MTSCILGSIAALCLAALLAYACRRHVARVREAAVQAERERLARLLHDGFLQSVQALMLRLDAIAPLLPASTPERAALERSLDLACQVIEEGRDQVRDLRAAAPEHDLADALARRVELLRTPGDAEVALHSSGAPLALRPEVCREALYIAAEALANALRHARARHIAVRLAWSADALALTVEDDGVGLRATSHAAAHGAMHGGWGLRGMRERAALIGASLTWRRRDGGGTLVRLLVPAAASQRHGQVGII